MRGCNHVDVDVVLVVDIEVEDVSVGAQVLDTSSRGQRSMVFASVGRSYPVVDTFRTHTYDAT